MDRHPMERLVEPEPDADGSSLLSRVGIIVAGGVLAAIASSFPAALRMGDDGSAGLALEQWIVLSAVGTPLGVAVVATLRRARVGLKLLVGERASIFALGVLWWCVIELGLLSVFGVVLKKTTHHHALAGVTFSAFAVATGALVGLLARRVTTMLARGSSGLQKIALVTALAAAVIGLMLVGVRTSKGEGLHTAAAIVDAFAFVIASLIASSRIFRRLRPVGVAGVPAALFVVLIGLTTLRFDPKLRASLMGTAPVHAVVMGLFGGGG
jgi:hypothetical protein